MQMMSKTKLTDDSLIRTIALAMQGMAFWHLVVGVAALGFTLVLLAAGASPDGEKYFIGGLTAAEVTGAAVASVLILGGISWWVLGKAFWRPRWSLILVPGLIGTATTGVFELMDWPVGFWSVEPRLTR
jgi:hypothetical protein